MDRRQEEEEEEKEELLPKDVRPRDGERGCIVQVIEATRANFVHARKVARRYNRSLVACLMVGNSERVDEDSTNVMQGILGFFSKLAWAPNQYWAVFNGSDVREMLVRLQLPSQCIRYVFVCPSLDNACYPKQVASVIETWPVHGHEYEIWPGPGYLAFRMGDMDVIALCHETDISLRVVEGMPDGRKKNIEFYRLYRYYETRATGAFTQTGMHWRRIMEEEPENIIMLIHFLMLESVYISYCGCRVCRVVSPDQDAPTDGGRNPKKKRRRLHICSAVGLT
jgi:hypothetical protein